MFLGVIILYYLINIVLSLQNLPGDIKSWFSKYKVNQKHKYLNLALISFFAKDYKKAHKIALKIIDTNTQTMDTFIALCVALETTISTNNNDDLIKALDKYNTYNYRLAKKEIIKGQKFD
jgi:uncharacterized protein HemY